MSLIKTPNAKVDDSKMSDGVGDANDENPEYTSKIQMSQNSITPSKPPNQDIQTQPHALSPINTEREPLTNILPSQPSPVKPKDVKIDIPIAKEEPNKTFTQDLGIPLKEALHPSQSSQGSDRLRVQITWENLSISVTEVKRRHCHKTVTTKQILENVSGTVKPGQFLAIMGSTGAGKTTLLNFLSGKMISPNLKKQGSVFLNGIPREKVDYSKFTAFVQQDDLFMECLTINECLTFAARCKCQGTDEVILKRVDDLIDELELIAVRDMILGGGQVTKGERKRTAIGIELITKPALVFLDEPTSGMDSFTATKVIEVIKKLAVQGGRTVLAVIHQPNSEIYSNFDQLMLLSLGQVIYFSNAFEAKAFFNCPSQMNPAEYFMVKMSKEGISSKEIKAKKMKEMGLPVEQQDDEVEEYDDNLIQEMHKDKIKILHDEFIKYAQPKMKEMYAPAANLTDFTKNQLKKYTPPWCTQFTMLAKREGKRTIRDKRGFMAKNMTSLILGVFMILIYHRIEKIGYQGFQNLAGFFMMMSMNLVMAGFSNAIQVFPDQRLVFMREQSSGLYCVSSYYLSYFLVSFPFALLIPTEIIVVGYLFTFLIAGIEITVAKFFLFWIGCVLVYLASEAYGLFISASFTNKHMIMPLFPMLVVPLMLLSGFYVDLNSVVHVVRELQYLSPYKYAFNFFGKNYLEDMVFTFTMNGRSTPVPGSYFLDKMSATYSIWECSLALCCIFLGFHILAFVSLKARAKKVG